MADHYENKTLDTKVNIKLPLMWSLKNLRSIILNKINFYPMQIPLYGYYHDVVKAIAKETSFSC